MCVITYPVTERYLQRRRVRRTILKNRRTRCLSSSSYVVCTFSKPVVELDVFGIFGTLRVPIKFHSAANRSSPIADTDRTTPKSENFIRAALLGR